MADPAVEEFPDVLAALARTEVPAAPAALEAAVATALARAPAPERVMGVEAAIARDADEAWSLAMAFLGDADAAREAVVDGFVRLGRSGCVAVSLADTLRAQAEAALEVARLLAKGGHQPEVCGASLAPEARLALLIQAGLGQPGVRLEGAPDPEAALLAAYPRPGHERGADLCRLLARELLGRLSADEAAALEALAREQPKVATLMRERYAEAAEVPLLVLPRVEELASRVQEQLARESDQLARVGALRVSVSVTCCYCHDGLGRRQAVFCAGCLAPHHEECFGMHGHCCAPGCDQKQVVRPTEPETTVVPAAPGRRRGLWPLALLLAAGTGAAAVTGYEAWARPARLAAAEVAVAQAEAPPAPGSAELLREAAARTARASAARAAARAQDDAVLRVLEGRQVSLGFDATPFHEAVDFLRDMSQLNYVVGADASDLIEKEQVTVSLRLREITLRNALDLIVASHDDLGWRVERGVVHIATAEELTEELVLEVYDVGSITSGESRAAGGFWLDPDRLIELIDGMDINDGGSVEVTNGTLIVRQGQRAHERIQRLLAYLRGEREGFESGSAEPAWVQTYEAALDRTITLDFPGAPLAEVVRFLQDVTGLNVTISPSVDTEALMVSVRLKDVPVRDALQIILEQTGLARSYRNETIMLSPPEGARGEYELRILHVADIEAWMEPDVLANVVQNAVGEDVWDDPASLDCHHQQLIIYQTRSVHEAVDDVLAKLRISHLRKQ